MSQKSLRETLGFVEDVRALYEMARVACTPLPPSMPEIELSPNFRCLPREEPDVWTRPYEPFDSHWVVLTASDRPLQNSDPPRNLPSNEATFHYSDAIPPSPENAASHLDSPQTDHPP